MAKRVRLKEDRGDGGNYFADPDKEGVDFISSGSKLLDLALGGGGWAENRIANIVGDKSTGKSLLCIEACVNFAFKYPKGKIRYREVESAFDQGYAAALGMPVDRVDFGDEQINTVEELFDDLSSIVSGAKHNELVIVDSLDAISDEAEMSRDLSQGSYGAEKAKKMSQLFRRLTRDMAHKHVTLIIVSQVRDKINAMFGRKTTRSGGRALDFYASQVLYLAHLGTLNKTVRGMKRPIGVKVKAKVDKNKVGLPFREAEFQIRFGYGVDDVQACVDWLTEAKMTKELGLTKDEAKDYLSVLLNMSAEDADAEVARLHSLVGQAWREMDMKVLPARSKYGAR